MDVDIKHIKTTLLLVLFLSLRVGNLHEFLHWHEDTKTEHCQLCDIISQPKEHILLLDDNTVKIKNNSLCKTYNKVFEIHYEQPRHCFVFPKFIYNKPPPRNTCQELENFV